MILIILCFNHRRRNRGAGGSVAPAPTSTLLPNVFDNTVKTDFGEHIFCPQMTQALSHLRTENVLSEVGLYSKEAP